MMELSAFGGRDSDVSYYGQGHVNQVHDLLVTAGKYYRIRQSLYAAVVIAVAPAQGLIK